MNLLPLAVLAAALASAEAPPLKVLSASPAGVSQGAKFVEEIVVTFNQPMVALASPSDMGRACPLMLSPSVAGRCRWRGTQVLAFEPSVPLPTATAFKAQITPGLKSAVSGRTMDEAYSWQFETARPALVDSRPRDGERWVALQGEFFLHFSLPMDPRRARADMVLRETLLNGVGPEREISLGVRRVTAEDLKHVWPYSWGEFQVSTWTVLAVKPAETLRTDRSYQLVLKNGLKADSGELGLNGERWIRFETYYTFRAISGPGRRCLPRSYELYFSNPVRFGDLVASTQLEGSTRPWRMDEGQEEYSGQQDAASRSVLLPMPDPGLEPDHEYALTISSGLRDVFGQALGAPARIAFSNDQFCPQLKMNGGFGVLEQGLPLRQPVDIVNIMSAPLRKAVIADDAFVPFYKGFRWGCRNEMDVPGPAKEWNLGLPRNSRLRTFIDLGAVYASTTPARVGGIAAIAVQGPDGCQHKAVLDATRVGLSLKSSPDSTVVWATYLKTGRPAAALPVELRDDENKVLWRGFTDASGLADAPGWIGLGIKDWPRWGYPNVWAFAKDRMGTAVLSLDWQTGLEPWRFDLNSDRSPRPKNYRVSMFTERGVYRAGETVHLKGLVRKLEKGDWRLLGVADPRLLWLTLKDARGAEVLKTTVTLSDMSSFDASAALRLGAPTGHWTFTLRESGAKEGNFVQAVSAGEGEGDGEGEGESSFEYTGEKINAGTTFRVEDFKPAAFEVKAVPSTSSWMAGDKYEANIEGWWLFGAPMTGATASWSLRLEPTFYAPPGWPEYTFSPAWRRRVAETGKILASADATLDAQGRAKAEAVLDLGAAQGPMSAAVEASVISPERQRLFARASSMVHRADLYYGIKSDTNFTEVGKRWDASVVAVRPDGRRAAEIGAAWVLRRREWLSIQRAGLAGRLEWVSEERESVVSSGTFAASNSTWTWTTTPDKPGYYEFSVAGKDEKGRAAETVRDFDVAGSGNAWWKRSDNDLIEIVADKDNYKPGETARLLVKSPFSEATALITVEREGILARWTQNIRGGAPLIRVPLDERAVPDVFVSVTLLHGRTGKQEYGDDGLDLSKPQAKFGYKMLNVDTGSRRLKVSVASDKGDYRPGGELKASVTVVDSEGKPAAAEVTLFAVDEGVLNLTSYATPDPFHEFYGPRPLLVRSADSRPFVIGQRSFGEKGKNRGGGGGRGSPLPGVDLRSNFSPTAFWGPTLKVGSDGKAAASFKLPDSLTRFRLMAVAHAESKFGSGEARAVVSKPLSLRPSLPRLARIGDEFEGGVVVHNFTKIDSTVTVALALGGTAVTVAGETSRRLFVPAGHAVETTWKCRAVALGASEFRFAAQSGAETDGLLWKVPVRATERFERSATSGVSDSSVTEMIARPTNVAVGGAGFEVTMSATAMSGLREGARYLLEYPYGCLEQRLSRALPAIVGADLVAEFGLGSLGELKSAAQRELDRIPDFQCAEGGYYYWIGCWRPDPWLTAYTLEAAALARKEGYRVPDESLIKAARWLKTYLGNDRLDWAYPYSASEDYASRAYAVYALGLNSDPQPAYFQKLFERRDRLPYMAKAYLLKAAKLSGSVADEKILADELMSQARVAPRTLHFEDPQGENYWWIHGSSARTTAVVLQAFLEARGGFPGDEKAVRWLVEERKNLGRWRTTVENSDSLRALQDYYRRYEKEVPAFTASVKPPNGGAALWSEKFAGRSLDSKRKSFGLDEFLGGNSTAKLDFVKEGVGRLYYDLVLSYAPASFDKPESEGFTVVRKVEPLNGDLRAGKRAKVTVTVTTPQDRSFVALEDPLPAGWEIVDTTLATEGAEQAGGLGQESERGWGWGTFERAERYDDRLQVFADYMTAGEHSWSYLIQATTPGKYHVPAAVVEAMYEPELFGRSASQTTEVIR